MEFATEKGDFKQILNTFFKGFTRSTRIEGFFVL